MKDKTFNICIFALVVTICLSIALPIYDYKNMVTTVDSNSILSQGRQQK